uniref:Uncharacterized protein n=1 Tax=Magallana gigas TaxID=29159 RepID=K1RJF3_MAGGI
MPIRSVAARNEVRRPTPEKKARALPTPPSRVLCKKSVGIREKVHTRVLITSRFPPDDAECFLFCFSDPPFRKPGVAVELVCT